MATQRGVLLVAVDGSAGSRAAADEAARLAKALGHDLLLAHIVDWSDYSFINAIEIDERARLRRREEKSAREAILEPMAAALAEQGLEVRIELRFGHPARTLAKLAEEVDARMVIAGTRGRSDMTSLILGSFSHGLVHMAKRPLLLVPCL